jgi:hypothetical protein
MKCYANGALCICSLPYEDLMHNDISYPRADLDIERAMIICEVENETPFLY